MFKSHNYRLWNKNSKILLYSGFIVAQGWRLELRIKKEYNDK